ncbi:formate-dependent nitrite reductase membrane component NrfD [Tamaricihabitans halophyticus]|uniref:Formate-dependent nitrite reductase membrane component NrfD n=1 Tax=Tamaricihabitans halophyticus TaxID=1262583 RepID=A0A4R2Q287_9PSEU|nr:NrfD/PsrC family molybdoenzyme membrane anchor subunit [Tamaricihabitans halophyticus]TCP42637.1 formate-dependent nitrite reductase membrane component NrfD [Tamaricihabitans halophyticus]
MSAEGRPDRTPVTTNDSYYGLPIVKEPAWQQPDVPLYLFLGGVAGVSASMAALARPLGRDALAKLGTVTAATGSVASLGALIHDLGRPARFLYMLRVFKPTSPLSVGSWILAPFSALASMSATSVLTGKFRTVGALAGAVAGILGPAMSTYTAVLLADTATPAWHEAYRELPVVFAGSAMTSAAGVALIALPKRDSAPVSRLAAVGATAELAAAHRLRTRLGIISETYRVGRAGSLLKAVEVLTGAGVALTATGRTSRIARALAGGAYLAAGLCTRFGVYAAGVASTRDPKYVVEPQRERRGRV